MKIFISSSVGKTTNEAIDIANKLGVNIEISKFANPDLLDGDYKSLVREYSENKNFNGIYSLHGTFFDLNPASKDSRILEITKYRYNQSFEIAKMIKAKTVVFHTGFNGLVKFPKYQAQFIEDKITFWKEFIKKFEDENITVVLENTYEDVPDIIIRILEGVNSNYLKACIDTGHVNINSPLTVMDWIEQFGQYLHHMHLHNNFGSNDEHNSLLNGTIDFKEVFKTLKKNNLKPNLILEIFRYEPSMESVKYIKELFSQTEVGNEI